MKQARFFSLVCWISWIILLSALCANIFSNIHTSVFCQNYEFVLYAATALLGLKIHLEAKAYNKTNLGLYISIIVIAFLIQDILYFMVYSAPHLSAYDPYLNVSSLISYFGIIAFCIIFLSRHIFKLKHFLFILFAFFLVDLIIFRIFLVDTNYFFSKLSFDVIVDIIGSFLDLFIFNLAILWLVYSKNKGSSLIASGIIVMTSSDIMISSCYIAQITTFLDSGELLWTAGLIMIMSGVMVIINNKSYNTRDWFRTNAAIKSRIISWAFSVTFMSILVFFAFMQPFAIIRTTFFVFFPTIMICYELIIAVFALIIGNAFEQPFKQIQTNVESMLVNNKENINANFTIDEFTFLQKHLVNTLELKEERDKVKKTFGETAATVVHDIASPINAMAIAIISLKKQAVDVNDIALLETSIKRVREISKNLLARYHSLDDESLENVYTVQDSTKTSRHTILSKPIENLPLAARTSSWGFSQINYTNNSVFAILDDDPAIIMLWQRIFNRNNLKAQYFFTATEFKDWFIASKLDKENIILLTDYSLGKEKITGVDIILKFNITNSYLFTSHAEETWMQQLATEKALKLSSKSLIETMKFIYC